LLNATALHLSMASSGFTSARVLPCFSCSLGLRLIFHWTSGLGTDNLLERKYLPKGRNGRVQTSCEGQSGVIMSVRGTTPYLLQVGGFMFSKRFQCPDCGATQGYRSRPRTFLEKYCLPVFLLRPVRCSNCFRRDYVSLRVQVAPSKSASHLVRELAA